MLGYLRTARRSAPAFAGLKAWPLGAHVAPAVLGMSWVSLAQRLEHPLQLVLLNQCRAGRRGASCARPAVAVPPPLEVGPRVAWASAACSRCSPPAAPPLVSVADAPTRPPSRRRSPSSMATAARGCPPTCCRHSATTSARTPSSASTTRASSSTPTGRAPPAGSPPTPTRLRHGLEVGLVERAAPRAAPA